MLKNAATGRCMEAGSAGTVTAVKMVTCNRNDEYQWWAPTGNVIYAPNSGPVGVDDCLLGATYNVPSVVYTGPCGGASGFTKYMTYGGSHASISPASVGGYISDVPGNIWAVNDTWQGTNSKWDWIS